MLKQGPCRRFESPLDLVLTPLVETLLVLPSALGGRQVGLRLDGSIFSTLVAFYVALVLATLAARKLLRAAFPLRRGRRNGASDVPRLGSPPANADPALESIGKRPRYSPAARPVLIHRARAEPGG